MPFERHVVGYEKYLLYQFDDDHVKTPRSVTFQSCGRRRFVEDAKRMRFTSCWGV